jgi:hypothetical protein
MYSVTIKNHLGQPMMQLAQVSSVVANHWYDTAIRNGYACELEYVGGTEPPNHRVANDQDMQQYDKDAA